MGRARMLGRLFAAMALSSACCAASAWAVDGLPPGASAPSWAKGRRVHFEPPEAFVSRADSSSPPSAPRLQYHGGLVQYQPRLVLVFMGKQWEDDVELRHELEATAQSLTGSAYQSILTQYSGLNGPISSPLAGSPVVEAYFDDRSLTGRVDGAAAGQEGDEVIKATGAGQDTNATYAVLPAPGTAEPEELFCGFHEQYGSGAVFTPGPSIAAIMDTEARAGCVSSKTLSHEYAESVTDPGLSGWNTGGGQEDEIGDICNGVAPGKLADGSLVAWLWDDSKQACEIEDGDAGSVPIGPYAQTSRRDPSPEGSTNKSVESELLETAIYPCDLEARYHFEYGTTTAYGDSTPESTVPPSWGAVDVNATIAGLEHSTPYHWRVVAQTANGSVDGVDHEFTIPYYVEIKEGSATGVGLSEATLNGEVRPVGVPAKYRFEYGTTEAYGSSTPEESAGSGNSFVAISAALSGLQVGTVYHYRLVASSSRGTTVGEDQRFETHGGKPAIEAQSALPRSYTEAALNAKLDAKGEQTEFYFEYGTTAAYGRQTPERSSQTLGSRRESASVAGLQAGATYHFRLVATNGYGTSYGADESLSMPEAPLVETGQPSAIGYDSATLAGLIDPRGVSTGYYFEYGVSLAYGARTAEVAAGSEAGGVEAAGTVGGLAQDTTYHVRLVASTVYGLTYGADQTFTTGSEPSAPTGGATAPLFEPIATPPAPSPIVGPAPTPTPSAVQPSLSVSGRGKSLTVVLVLPRAVAGLTIDVTAPYAQLGKTKTRGRSRMVLVARLVRHGFAAGRSKLRLIVDAAARRALRRRRLRLTVTATIASFGGERRTVSRALLVGRRRASRSSL